MSMDVNFVNKYVKKQADAIAELVNVKLQMEVQLEIAAEQITALKQELDALKATADPEVTKNRRVKE